jgi:hypothetical protein
MKTDHPDIPKLHLDQADQPNVLELFAATLAEAQKRWGKGDCLIPQGTLWCGWCVRNGFRLDDLQALGRPDGLNVHWPAPLKEAHRLIHSGKTPAFHAALNFALNNHQCYGVNEVSELARILAAVAQTLRPVGKAGRDYQQSNGSLAKQAGPSAQRQLQEALRPNQPPLPPQQRVPTLDLGPYQQRSRPDEQGMRVTAAGLTLWHASHRGPEHAGKLKNQDATFALAVGNSLVFALADGVSTSMGSRIAAAIVARSFCEHLATCLHSSRPNESLRAAAMKAQERLDWLLTKVETSPNGAEFNDLYDGLQPSAVRRILENTRTRKNRSLPLAFATTLLGGFVSPDNRSGYQVYIVCVGDGLVEHRSSQGSITAVLTMDNQETAISATICPGLFGQESLRQAALQTCRLTSGDYLLISSDGLTRGHQQSVWMQLERSGAFQGIAPDSEQMAWQILDRACRVADARVEEPRLFGDNLSLLLLKAQ